MYAVKVVLGRDGVHDCVCLVFFDWFVVKGSGNGTGGCNGIAAVKLVVKVSLVAGDHAKERKLIWLVVMVGDYGGPWMVVKWQRWGMIFEFGGRMVDWVVALVDDEGCECHGWWL